MQNLSKYAGLNYHRAGISVDMTAKQGPLLSYSSLTFSRTSGNAYFWDYITPTVVGGFGVNALRSGTISGKVFAQIEGSAENKCERSQALDLWSMWDGASATADTAVAPDGTTTADTATFGAASSSNLYRTPAYTNGQLGLFSVWLRSVTGTTQCRIGLEDSVGSTLSADLSLTTTWQRFSISRTMGAGPYYTYIVNKSGGGVSSLYAWQGDVLVASPFVQSPILTAAAAVARTADVGFWASAIVPAAMLSGSWTVDIYPEYSSVELHAFVKSVFIQSIDGNNGIFINWSDCSICLYAGGVEKLNTGVLSWASGAHLVLAFNSVAGTLTLSGFTSGNGVHSGTSWSYSAADWYHGVRFDGTSGLFGLISEPY